MINKITVFIAISVLPWLPFVAAAEDAPAVSEPAIVAEINASGNITVTQPAFLDSIVARQASVGLSSVENVDKSNQATTRSGYRVQVFDDNNPRTAASQAKARQAQMETAFPALKTYVTFNSPYWRVKVGDFRTRAEAEIAADEIRSAFPSLAGYLRIVRDKINNND